MAGKSEEQKRFEERMFQANLKAGRLSQEEIDKHDILEKRNLKLKNKRLQNKTGRIAEKMGYIPVTEATNSIVYKIEFNGTGLIYIGVSCTKTEKEINNDILWKLNHHKFGNRELQQFYDDGLPMSIEVLNYVQEKSLLNEIKLEYINQIPPDKRLNKHNRFKIEKLNNEQASKIKFLEEQEKDQRKKTAIARAGATEWYRKQEENI